jgi:hypothetical protein
MKAPRPNDDAVQGSAVTRRAGTTTGPDPPGGTARLRRHVETPDRDEGGTTEHDDGAAADRPDAPEASPAPPVSDTPPGGSERPGGDAQAWTLGAPG